MYQNYTVPSLQGIVVLRLHCTLTIHTFWFVYFFFDRNPKFLQYNHSIQKNYAKLTLYSFMQTWARVSCEIYNIFLEFNEALGMFHISPWRRKQRTMKLINISLPHWTFNAKPMITHRWPWTHRKTFLPSCTKCRLTDK